MIIGIKNETLCVNTNTGILYGEESMVGYNW